MLSRITFSFLTRFAFGTAAGPTAGAAASIVLFFLAARLDMGFPVSTVTTASSVDASCWPPALSDFVGKWDVFRVAFLIAGSLIAFSVYKQHKRYISFARYRKCATDFADVSATLERLSTNRQSGRIEPARHGTVSRRATSLQAVPPHTQRADDIRGEIVGTLERPCPDFGGCDAGTQTDV